MTRSVPSFIQPVLGFRAWKLTADGELLPRAVSALEHLRVEPWRPGRNDARCVYVGLTRCEHAAPGAGCDCGLHAYHDVTAVRTEWRSGDCLVGAVVAWGDLQVHRAGFRAQHAQVGAIATPASPRLACAAQAAAERYAVPLAPFDELQSRGAAHGAPLPRAARPTRWTQHPTRWRRRRHAGGRTAHGAPRDL